MDERVPVTLLAGFLGSGKTTLLNRILAAEDGPRVAVVVNEFGDVGIDGRLVKRREEDLIELKSGCICCTVREDLRATLAQLAGRRRRRLLGRARFDRVVIEASGMASPGPAVQTLLVDGELADVYRPSGVVTMCHAVHVANQLDEHPEAAEQVAYADLLLLNHVDRGSETILAAAEEALRACNAVAPIERCVRAEVDPSTLLALDPLGAEAARSDACARADCDHVHHTSGVGTVTLRTEVPLSREALSIWLRFLAQREGQQLMRAKGILRLEGDPRPHVLQGIYQWIELAPSAGAAPAESVLVLIGRDLDRAELERGWAATLGQSAP